MVSKPKITMSLSFSYSSVIYWTEYGQYNKVSRIGFDGSGQKVIADTDLRQPTGVALYRDGKFKKRFI